jgi:hypothetical protein
LNLDQSRTGFHSPASQIFSPPADPAVRLSRQQLPGVDRDPILDVDIQILTV